MRIGNVTLPGSAVLAPLAGVTDVGFRSLARHFGAALTYTEMVSAKGLVYGNRATQSLLETTGEERPAAVQLFGSEPSVMAEAVRRPELSKFAVIDINMGCPVPKIVNNGEGSALMKDPARAARIVSACVSAAGGRPVTVKFRKGFDETTVNCAEFARAMEGGGAAAIAIHGRTRSQMYSGRADWDAVADVVRAVHIPVFGNGDVFTPEDAAALRERTGCAGVMVARGALGRPWIFAELEGRKPDMTLRETISTHIEVLSERFPERFVTLTMRKHLAWYCKGLKDAARLRTRVNACATLAELQEIVQSIPD